MKEVKFVSKVREPLQLVYRLVTMNHPSSSRTCKIKECLKLLDQVPTSCPVCLDDEDNNDCHIVVCKNGHSICPSCILGIRTAFENTKGEAERDDDTSPPCPLCNVTMFDDGEESTDLIKKAIRSMKPLLVEAQSQMQDLEDRLKKKDVAVAKCRRMMLGVRSAIDNLDDLECEDPVEDKGKRKARETKSSTQLDRRAKIRAKYNEYIAHGGEKMKNISSLSDAKVTSLLKDIRDRVGPEAVALYQQRMDDMELEAIHNEHVEQEHVDQPLHEQEHVEEVRPVQDMNQAREMFYDAVVNRRNRIGPSPVDIERYGMDEALAMQMAQEWEEEEDEVDG